MSVIVAGVGMHPWGKWGRNFVEYGVVAARAALEDAGVAWQDVDLIVGGETVRNGYGGYVAGATLAQALGWNGARVATSYAACATGAQALDTARARILAGLSEVALVVGADTTPKGFLAPNAGERWDDPDWLRFRLLGMTNPAYFALHARRRMDLYGATSEDFAAVKVKNSRHGLANPSARYRKEVSVADVVTSAVVCDPLHLLDICATSDGAAAVILCSQDYAARHGLTSEVKVAAISTVTPTFPNTVIDMPLLSTDAGAPSPSGVEEGTPRPSPSGVEEGAPRPSPSGVEEAAPRPSPSGVEEAAPRPSPSGVEEGAPRPSPSEVEEGAPRPSRNPTFKQSIGHAAYEEAGIGPEDVDVAEVYDLSTALELDWMEDLALCKPGEAERLLRAGDTTIGGRIPVNPSGGLACFGEAVPAQALAQVCELTWQLRGRAEGRQVEGARVGISANQGLFGHGSAVLLTR